MPLRACECTASILHGAEHKAVFAKSVKMLISVSDELELVSVLFPPGLPKYAGKFYLKGGV